MKQIAPRIVIDQRVQGGKPVITGTRVPVEAILGALASGEPMERIMSEYRIQREDVLAAIAYAAIVVSGEDIREVGDAGPQQGLRTSPVATRTQERKRASVPRSQYQLLVTLQDIEPAIWRRLRVPSDITLFKLHGILQLVMGWQNYHLHQFIAGDELYGALDPELPGPRHDEKKTLLFEVLGESRDRLLYEYDFGDGWAHDVVLEKISESDSNDAATVLAGERACPPEDCGGPHGYEEMLEALPDPTHPRHLDMREWIGRSFDSETFDLAKVNRTLAARSRTRNAPRPRPTSPSC